MTPDKQAVIFDWNGTLFADTRLAVDATNKAIELFGMPPAPVSRHQKEYSIPLKQFYLGLGCDEKELDQRLDEVFAVWGGHYNARAHKMKLRRGARDLLSSLREKGNHSAILSNYTVENISLHTKRLGVHHLFDAILANASHELKDIMHKADKGSRLKAFANRHDIRKALVVGDSPEEIEIAHSYGFLGVGLAGGFCSAARIRAAKPDFMINSLTEMPDIVRRVFGSGRDR